MKDKRASNLEVDLYLESLLYAACKGGGDAVSSDPLVDAVKSLLSPVWDSIIQPSVKDYESIFFNPSYPPSVFRSAYKSAQLKVGLNIPRVSHDYFEDNGKESLFWSNLLTGKQDGLRFLQCCRGFVPSFDFPFTLFAKYDIVTDIVPLYLLLTLRKGIEGDDWNNVDLFLEFPENECQYDIIHSEVDRFGVIKTSKYHLFDFESLPLASSGALIAGRDQYDKQQELPNIESVFQLPRDDVFIHRHDRRVYVLRKSVSFSDSIVFVDGSFYFRTAVNKDAGNDVFWSKETIDLIQQHDKRFTACVNRSSILPDNLNPIYYVMLQHFQKEDYVPLKRFASPGETCGLSFKVRDLKDSGYVKNTRSDPRLIPLIKSPSIPNGSPNYLTRSGIIISTYHMVKHFNYVEVEEGERVQVDGFDRYVIHINPELADWRYILLVLRSLPYPTIENGVDELRVFSSVSDILELPVPNLSLEEQNKEVEVYLKKLKKDFVAPIEDRTSSLQLIVFTPDRSKFETANETKMDALGFKVLEYVDDPDNLGAAIRKHHGDNVLSSNLADAVVICADIPADELVDVMYAVKSDIKVFYYSDNLSYDDSRIRAAFRDDFRNGFIKGADYLEQIRKNLDSDAIKVREQYQSFFDAADNLDKKFGWDLAEFATECLSHSPFIIHFTDLRIKIDNTIIAFYKQHRVAPQWLGNTSVASLIADRQYHDSNTQMDIILEEGLPNEVLSAESWYKYALVTLRKLGDKYSHNDKKTLTSSFLFAAFTLFMEYVIWFDSVADRYMDNRRLFTIKKRDYIQTLHTVRSYTVDGKAYHVADKTVHLIDPKHILASGDQVLILSRLEEKMPRKIDGHMVDERARPDGWVLVTKASNA